MISTPPEAPDIGAGKTPPAASACAPVVEVMRKRADFLACARARRQGTGTMLVQGRDRCDGSANGGSGDASRRRERERGAGDTE